MAENNREILALFLQEVWTDGEIDAADQYLAPAYTIHHDPGDPWDGQTLDLAGFKARVRQSRAPFPDQRFEIDELISEGDKVAASWRWQGTHLGDMPGFPASGRQISMSGITIYTFEEERISGHWQVTDHLSVYRQLNS